MRWDKVEFEGAQLATSENSSIADGLPAHEVAVIEMALVEGPRSVRADSPWRRLSRLLFGIHAFRPLANERLEAIRKFAVAAWFTDEIPDRLIREIFESGLSSNDLWRVLAYVASRRGKMPRVILPAY